MWRWREAGRELISGPLGSALTNTDLSILAFYFWILVRFTAKIHTDLVGVVKWWRNYTSPQLCLLIMVGVSVSRYGLGKHAYESGLNVLECPVIKALSSQVHIYRLTLSLFLFLYLVHSQSSIPGATRGKHFLHLSSRPPNKNRIIVYRWDGRPQHPHRGSSNCISSAFPSTSTYWDRGLGLIARKRWTTCYSLQRWTWHAQLQWRSLPCAYL